ncbi:MAG TPA: non-homologous end-joining DNA ligase [Mycobacteriales bacterium]
MAEARPVTVEVEGHRLRLSNLDKVLYPEAGVTKAEVIDYYTRISAALLPHLAGRPLTLKRYPNGVASQSFYEKNAPSHAPDWVRTVRLPVPGSTKGRDEIDFLVCDDLPTLVWVANLAAIELHTPQWTVGPDGAVHGAGQIVFDLDPGAPATVAECCQVAVLLRERLDADGLAGYPKTSGRKGLQVYAPVTETDPRQVSAYARELAVRLERGHPDLVVSRMAKSLRTGRVLIDWSQNNAAKTTIAPYSLRAQDSPTVSTPLRWEEVSSGPPLVYTAPQVLERVRRHGDLFAGVLGGGVEMPPRTVGSRGGQK